MNPFKVGDKVKLLKRSYEFNPIFWRRYEGFKYSFVRGVVGDTISTSEDISPQHYSHFELYKEEKDMNQQTQPKEKRVPFSAELWKKYKDVADVVFSGTNYRVLRLESFPQGLEYEGNIYYFAAVTHQGSIVLTQDRLLSLIIPVTIKHVPFSPELKDAKVFYGETELTEWFQAKTGVVCGTHTVNSFGGEDTSLYHPNDLHMEIEEDV